jgi:predicted DNA-binding transcriptional regulator YafY
VEPYQAVHRWGRWYLVAYDLDRDDWRIFRLDRLRLRTPGGPRFAPRQIPAEDAGSFVVERLGRLQRTHAAVLRLHAPLADVEPWFHPSWGRLEAVDEQHCLMHTAADSYESIALGVGLAGLEFDVVEPAELRGHLAALGARLLRAAETP